MAKVMASTYRWSEEKDGEVEHHVLRPGDDPGDLPKDVRKDLEKRKLVVDEKRFDKSNGVVLPPGYEVEDDEVVEAEEEDEELPRNTPVRTVSQLADTRDEEERKKQAEGTDPNESKDSNSKKSSKKSD